MHGAYPDGIIGSKAKAKANNGASAETEASRDNVAKAKAEFGRKAKSRRIKAKDLDHG